MTLTLYGLKTCDTCRKALVTLKDRGHAVTVVDIRSETNLTEKLPRWIDAVGLSGLINKRSTTWRTLSDADRAALEGDTAISVLSANPTLIKRPVIEAGDKVLVGWTEAVQDELT